MEKPYKSVKQYIKKSFCDIYEDVIIVSDYENRFDAAQLTENNYNNIFKKAKNELNSVLNDQNRTVLDSSMNESAMIKEIGKCDFGGDIFEDDNYNHQFLNILNISKNESFGDVYMFLCKPSPLSLRVKSKIAELFLLRRIDASDISFRYPNIWAKFFQKSYKNMLSIKALTIKKIKYYWKNLGIHRTKKHKGENMDLSEDKGDIKSSLVQSVVPKVFVSNIEGEQNNKNTGIFTGTSIANNKNSIIGNMKNTESIKYISFGRDSTSNLNFLDKNYRSCYSGRKMNMEVGQISEVDKKLNTQFQKNKLKLSKFNMNDTNKKNFHDISENGIKRAKTIKDIRMEHLIKLKIKIKKLKTSKKYYKDLCKKLKNKIELFSFKQCNNNDNNNNLNNKEKISNNIKELNDRKSYNSEKINNINININFNNNNVILDKAEINISNSSIHSNSNSNSSSSSSSFNSSLIITSQINLTFTPKYKNLDYYTSGEYSKNRNLRQTTQNFLQFYLSSFKKNIKEKIFEPNLSNIYPLKNGDGCCNMNSNASASFDSGKKKINIENKNASNNSLFKTLSGINEQYLIVFDRINNSFNFYGKSMNKKRFSLPNLENIKNNEFKLKDYKDNCIFRNKISEKLLTKNNGIKKEKILFYYNENNNKE